MFHGAGATAELARQNTGWGALADEAGFLAVFPEGTRRDSSRPPMFRQNPQTWNDGSGRGHVARANVDDVAFTAALLDTIIRDERADPSRMLLTGFSNGAAMVFRAGIELASRITAIAPVAGHCWPEPTRLSRPVPLCLLVGELDPLNPLEGGEVSTPWGVAEYHPPPIRSAERWSRAVGCTGAPAVVQERPLRLTRFGDCPDAAEVLYGVIPGLGHVWPGGTRLLPQHLIGPASNAVNGARFIWDWFAQRRHLPHLNPRP